MTDEMDAPLDPSKVKAGDTVTLQGDRALVEGEVQAVDKHMRTDLVIKVHHSWFRIEGDDAWTLTAHQPAPKPEWALGTLADITAGGNQVRAIRQAFPDSDAGWVTIPGSAWWWDKDVTDVRPLVVIDPATVDWRSVQSQMSVLVVGAEPFKRAGEILDVVRRELGIEVAR